MYFAITFVVLLYCDRVSIPKVQRVKFYIIEFIPMREKSECTRRASFSIRIDCNLSMNPLIQSFKIEKALNASTLTSATKIMKMRTILWLNQGDTKTPWERMSKHLQQLIEVKYLCNSFIPPFIHEKTSMKCTKMFTLFIWIASFI